jgi:NAD(P)-dependent dehydrogenase (short-subunit alcohol dehydrogenase family)
MTHRNGKPTACGNKEKIMASPFTALIIGASRGIGLGIVRQLSMQGWLVVATCRGAGVTLLSVHPGWVQTDMGGTNATLTVEQSCSGIVSQVLAWRGKGGHHFIDYSGKILRW